MAVPACLCVFTGDGRDKTDGVYVLTGALANGQPTWRKNDERWLYSSPKGCWTVTDTQEHFGTGWGYVVSSKHRGCPPTSRGLTWKGTEGDSWKVLPSMVVADNGSAHVASAAVSPPVPSAATLARPSPSVVAAVGVDAEEAAAAETAAEALCMAEERLRASQQALGLTASEEAIVRRCDHVQRVAAATSHKVASLKNALVCERRRAGEAEATCAPLVEETNHWRKTAQELIQVKIQAESELQDIRELAQQRLREKDRAITTMEEEVANVHESSDALARQLEAARRDAEEARRGERAQARRVSELERHHAELAAALLRQERLLEQRRVTHATLDTTHRQQQCAEERVRGWAGAQSPPLTSPPVPASTAAVVATAATALSPGAVRMYVPVPDPYTEYGYELDDDVPPGEGMEPAETEPVRQASGVRRRAAEEEEGEWGRREPPGWPSNDAVVASLTAIIRGTAGPLG